MALLGLAKRQSQARQVQGPQWGRPFLRPSSRKRHNIKQMKPEFGVVTIQNAIKTILLFCHLRLTIRGEAGLNRFISSDIGGFRLKIWLPPLHIKRKLLIFAVEEGSNN